MGFFGEAAHGHRGFGLAVKLGKYRPKSCDCLFEAVRRNGRGAVNDVAPAARIVFAEIGMIQKHIQHGGHQEGRGDFLLLCQFQEFFRIEMVHDEAHSSPDKNRDHQAASGMRQRSGKTEDFIIFQPELKEFGQECPDPGTMGEHHPLGQPGSSAGKIYPAEFLGQYLCLGRFCRVVLDESLQMEMSWRNFGRIIGDTDKCLHRLHKRNHVHYTLHHFFMVNERLAFGLVHHINMVVVHEKDGQRHPNDPALGQGILGKNILGAVGHKERDSVALLKPLLC